MNKSIFLLISVFTLVLICQPQNAVAKNKIYLGHVYNGKMQGNIPRGLGAISIGNIIINGTFDIDNSIKNATFNIENQSQIILCRYKGDITFDESNSFTLKKGGTITYYFDSRGLDAYKEYMSYYQYGRKELRGFKENARELFEDEKVDYAELTKDIVIVTHPIPNQYILDKKYNFIYTYIVKSKDYDIYLDAADIGGGANKWLVGEKDTLLVSLKYDNSEMYEYALHGLGGDIVDFQNGVRRIMRVKENGDYWLYRTRDAWYFNSEYSAMATKNGTWFCPGKKPEFEVDFNHEQGKERSISGLVPLLNSYYNNGSAQTYTEPIEFIVFNRYILNEKEESGLKNEFIESEIKHIVDNYPHKDKIAVLETRTGSVSEGFDFLQTLYLYPNLYHPEDFITFYNRGDTPFNGVGEYINGKFISSEVFWQKELDRKDSIQKAEEKKHEQALENIRKDLSNKYGSKVANDYLNGKYMGLPIGAIADGIRLKNKYYDLWREYKFYETDLTIEAQLEYGGNARGYIEYFGNGVGRLFIVKNGKVIDFGPYIR